MAVPDVVEPRNSFASSSLLPRRVAAGIVVFQPDPTTLLQLIDTIRPDVSRVFVFLNSTVAPALRDGLKGRDAVTIIEATTNLGIGAALNFIALAAILAGHDDIVVFDQDSQPLAETVAALSEAQAMLLASGQSPAIVAPRMVVATTDSKAPTYRFRTEGDGPANLRAADFVPTSGSLIRLDVLRRIGAFRTDYFIDGIDLEWSFRAWAKGFSCWVVLDRPMPHAVGTGVIEWRAIGFRMPKQRPFRMYCTVRNTVFGFRLPHVPARWKLQQAAYLPVQILAYAWHHRLNGDILRLLAAGILDGARGRLGVPKGVPDGRNRSTTPRQGEANKGLRS